jgi:PAS domain S-box-containing protein
MVVHQNMKNGYNITIRHILKRNLFFSQWIILCVALMVVGSIIGLNIFLEHKRTLSNEQERLLTSTKILQENIGQNLMATRDVLVDLRKHFSKREADKDLVTRLQTLSDAIPGVRTISIIDASGTWLASNRREYIGKNFSHRDYFKIPQQQPDRNILYITPPYKSKLGSVTISVCVIIPGRNGEFAGVVMAGLDPGYFAPILDSVLYAPDMWVGIAHWDGHLFMLKPERTGLGGNKFEQGGFFFTHRNSGKEFTVHSGKANITGDDRLLVVRTVRPASLNTPTPLTVAASRNRSAVFANWRNQALKFAFLYLMIALASIIGFYFFQFRQKQFSRQIAEAEKSLRETGDYLENLINYASAPIIVWNPQFCITRFNHGFESLTGRRANDVMGKPLSLLFPADQVESSMEVIRKTSTGERWEDVEIEILRLDGAIRIVLWNSATIYESDGKTMLATIAQGVDITERKKAEDNLVDAVKELERSNKELDDFAYIASHDLKEPLRGIHNYSSFLLEDCADKLDDVDKNKLNTLVYLTKRLESFINELLKFSRVGRVTFTMDEIKIDDVVKDALVILKPTLEKEHIDIRIPRPLPKVKCDHYQIVEVFQNLISNSVKYNDKLDKWIEIGYIEREKISAYDIFYVRDNGIGIDKKYHDSIFTIFKRLHGRDKFGGGTGAGLTIVKKIIERHGGKIWLESIPAEGSTFYFTLEGERNDRY